MSEKTEYLSKIDKDDDGNLVDYEIGPSIIIMDKETQGETFSVILFTKDGKPHHEEYPAFRACFEDYILYEYFENGRIWKREFFNKDGELNDTQERPAVEQGSIDSLIGHYLGVFDIDIPIEDNDKDKGFYINYNNGEFQEKTFFKYINEQRVTHNENGPAIIFKDGTEQLAYNGLPLVKIYPEQKEWVEDFIYDCIEENYENQKFMQETLKHEEISESVRKTGFVCVNDSEGAIVCLEKGLGCSKYGPSKVSRFREVELIDRVMPKNESSIVGKAREQRIEYINDGVADRKDGPSFIDIFKDHNNTIDGQTKIVEQYYENDKLVKVLRKNQNKELHQVFFPAVEIGNFTNHYKTFHTPEHLPNEEQGILEYWIDGVKHKTEYVDKDNNLHREDGPAVICERIKSDQQTHLGEFYVSSKMWYKRGVPHRENGPAKEFRYEFEDETIFISEFFKDGIRQRVERRNDLGELTTFKGYPSIEFVQELRSEFYKDGALIGEMFGELTDPVKVVKFDHECGLVHIENLKKGTEETVSIEDYDNGKN